MANPLDSIEEQLTTARDRAAPPLDQWDPPYSGDIDIVIDTDGEWRHEGTVFRRTTIVDLFTSILRREGDGHYYLVTPVEKWRIQVEGHALQVTDINRDATSGVLTASCRYGPDVVIGAAHPLLPTDGSDVPWLQCDNGLTASVTRSVWYRLVDAAAEDKGKLVLSSGDWTYVLGDAAV